MNWRRTQKSKHNKQRRRWKARHRQGRGKGRKWRKKKTQIGTRRKKAMIKKPLIK